MIPMLRRDLPRLATFIAEDDIERVYLPYAALQPLADSVKRGALKLMLDERDPPDPDELARTIADAHGGLRPVAIHCATIQPMKGRKRFRIDPSTTCTICAPVTSTARPTSSSVSGSPA